MNTRNQHLETLLFGNPDRIPFKPGHGRKSTRERWYTEGLPEGADQVRHGYQQIGGKLALPDSGPALPVNERMIPMFEEKVLERREGSLIVQDWKGNVCEISDQYSVEYLRNAIDFVTRRWIKCPVESWADWEDMKTRYDAHDVSRIPWDQALRDQLQQRDHFVELQFSGPFWQLREWVGFEQLCMLFYDDPKLTEAMLEFWKDYVAELLVQAFEVAIPDSVHISEDMAYKQFSMISPSMCRKYLLPIWKHWGEIIRSAGVPIYACDSDGFIGELIPLWIEAGINVCDPIEVAAGNDIVAFRQEFGKDMAYRGGVDKRAMAKGGRVIEEEMARLQPVIESGGFIPSCDHGIPSDVSWDCYLQYLKLLAKATGWL